jgi:hypothetical protein
MTGFGATTNTVGTVTVNGGTLMETNTSATTVALVSLELLFGLFAFRRSKTPTIS